MSTTTPVKAVVSPTPTPVHFVSPNPSKLPNKLVVTRPEDKTDHLAALTITITDEAKVRKLYVDIFALPTYPSGIPLSCPIEKYSTYLLDFYQNTILISHGEYIPTGCPTIKLDNINARLDLRRTFGLDFQQAIGLNSKDFYGYQH